MIRHANSTDIQTIRNIYNHYIRSSTITFEESDLSFDEMRQRIYRIQNDYNLPYLVAEENGAAVGYAYASQWRSRSAYRFTAETSIYLHKDYRGNGTGSALMSRLITECSERGLRNLIAGISLPNNASVGFHEKLGFKKTAIFREVGYKFNTWIDVGYWQLKLS